MYDERFAEIRQEITNAKTNLERTALILEDARESLKKNRPSLNLKKPPK